MRLISRTVGARFGGNTLKTFEIMEYGPLVDEVKELIHKKQYKVLKAINSETIAKRVLYSNDKEIWMDKTYLS